MKGILIGITVFIAAGAVAKAQSFGYLMKRADLVVAGDVKRDNGTRRFELYNLEGIELIKGDLESPDFNVVRFKDIGCQPQLFQGERALLFLKRLSGDIDGLEGADPAYTVLAGELGRVRLQGDQEPAVLEAVRRYAVLETLDTEERAAVTAGIFRSALTGDSEVVLYSALYDMVSTPGAMNRLSRGDGVKALERFINERSSSRLRRRLLYFAGEMLPPGLTEALEPLVRSREGCLYRDTSAAILSRLDDPATPQRLITGFAGLGRLEQENVIHVLGRLGEGRGVPALRALSDQHLDVHHALIIDALTADRTDPAADLLYEIAAGKHQAAAGAARAALLRINTQAARLHLQQLKD